MDRTFASSVITSCKLCLKLQVLLIYLAWWSIVRERACILLSSSFLTCRIFRMLRKFGDFFSDNLFGENLPEFSSVENTVQLDLSWNWHLILASSGWASLNNNLWAATREAISSATWSLVRYRYVHICTYIYIYKDDHDNMHVDMMDDGGDSKCDDHCMRMIMMSMMMMMEATSSWWS